MSRRLWITAAVAAFALIVAACGGDDSSDSGSTDGDGGSGQISASGSSTVEPITALNAEAFRADNPDVTISVEGPGTGDGFKKFCAGQTDISDASRPIKDSEKEACAEAGIEWIELNVAIDGLSVLTSNDNDIHQCVTFNDLYALLGPESTGFGQWADAAGLAQEIGGVSAVGVYEPVDLVVTAPGEESGTYDTFVEFIFDDLAEERGVESGARLDYTASANDNIIIDGISGSTYSLGWVGYAFYLSNEDRVKALEVNNGDSGCASPTSETIADGTYPLSRPLYIYVNATSLPGNPVLESFVDYYLSEDGLAAIDQAGYVRLPDYGPVRSAWENKVIGS